MRVNFSSDSLANTEGLLAVNRGFCKMKMTEKAPHSVPPNCAVLPKPTDDPVHLGKAHIYALPGFVLVKRQKQMEITLFFCFAVLTEMHKKTTIDQYPCGAQHDAPHATAVGKVSQFQKE